MQAYGNSNAELRGELRRAVIYWACSKRLDMSAKLFRKSEQKGWKDWGFKILEAS